MIADWVVAAGTTVGYLAGHLVARRRPRAPKTVKAVCPCGHSVSFHERGAGICRAEDESLEYNARAGSSISRWRPCRCQHYAGPEVISSMTMRPVSYREITQADTDQA